MLGQNHQRVQRMLVTFAIVIDTVEVPQLFLRTQTPLHSFPSPKFSQLCPLCLCVANDRNEAWLGLWNLLWAHLSPPQLCIFTVRAL